MAMDDNAPETPTHSEHTIRDPISPAMIPAEHPDRRGVVKHRQVMRLTHLLQKQNPGIIQAPRDADIALKAPKEPIPGFNRLLRRIASSSAAVQTAVPDQAQQSVQGRGTTRIAVPAAVGNNPYNNKIQGAALAGLYSFQRTTTMNYMRRSLALKYQHVMLAKDMISIASTTASMLESKLEAIKLNTAAPEVAKNSLMSRLKNATVDHLMKKAAGFIGDKSLEYAVPYIKARIVDPARKRISEIREKARKHPGGAAGYAKDAAARGAASIDERLFNISMDIDEKNGPLAKRGGKALRWMGRKIGEGGKWLDAQTIPKMSEDSLLSRIFSKGSSEARSFVEDVVAAKNEADRVKKAVLSPEVQAINAFHDSFKQYIAKRGFVEKEETSPVAKPTAGPAGAGATASRSYDARTGKQIYPDEYSFQRGNAVRKPVEEPPTPPTPKAPEPEIIPPEGKRATSKTRREAFVDKVDELIDRMQERFSSGKKAFKDRRFKVKGWVGVNDDTPVTKENIKEALHDILAEKTASVRERAEDLSDAARQYRDEQLDHLAKRTKPGRERIEDMLFDAETYLEKKKAAFRKSRFKGLYDRFRKDPRAFSDDMREQLGKGFAEKKKSAQEKMEDMLFDAETKKEELKKKAANAYAERSDSLREKLDEAMVDLTAKKEDKKKDFFAKYADISQKFSTFVDEQVTPRMEAMKDRGGKLRDRLFGAKAEADEMNVTSGSDVQSFHSSFNEWAKSYRADQDAIIGTLEAILEKGGAGGGGEVASMRGFIRGPVTTAIAGAWQIGRGIAKTAFGIGKGYAAVARGTIMGTAKVIGSVLGAAPNHPLVDVYRADQLGKKGAKPLVTKRQLQDGLVFANGKPVVNVRDIKQPVYDPLTKDALITEEDISVGLVDKNGKSIYKNRRFNSLLAVATDLGKFGIKTAGGVAKSAVGLGKPLLSMYASIIGAMTQGVVGVTKFTGKTIVDTLSGKGIVAGLAKGAVTGIFKPVLGLYKSAFEVTGKVILGIGGMAKNLILNTLGIHTGKDGGMSKYFREDLKSLVANRLDDILDLLEHQFTWQQDRAKEEDSRKPKPNGEGAAGEDDIRKNSYADRVRQLREKREKRNKDADDSAEYRGIKGKFRAGMNALKELTGLKQPATAAAGEAAGTGSGLAEAAGGGAAGAAGASLWGKMGGAASKVGGALKTVAGTRLGKAAILAGSGLALYSLAKHAIGTKNKKTGERDHGSVAGNIALSGAAAPAVYALGKTIAPTKMAGIGAKVAGLGSGMKSTFSNSMSAMKAGGKWAAEHVASGAGAVGRGIGSLAEKASPYIPKATGYAMEKAGMFAGKAMASPAAGAIANAGIKSVGRIADSSVVKMGGAALNTGLKAGGAIAEKTGLKALAKVIPGIGAIAGLGFGVKRLTEGDYLGAGAEVLSGLVGLVPGWGTAGALAIQGWLGYRDYKNSDPRYQLEKARLEAYGIEDSSLLDYTKSIESRAWSVMLGVADKFTMSDYAEMSGKFGLDPDNDQSVRYFAAWFNTRFMPNFSTLISILSSHGITYDRTDEMTDEVAADVLEQFKKQTQAASFRLRVVRPDKKAFLAFLRAQGKDPDTKSPTTLPSSKPYDPTKGANDNGTSPTGGINKSNLAGARNGAVLPGGNTINLNGTDGSGQTSSGNSFLNKLSNVGKSVGSALGIGEPSGKDVAAWKAGSGLVGKDQKPISLSDEVGSLSAKFESSTAGGSSAVGDDSTGGTSYGTYQIASKVGTFSTFKQWLKSRGGDASKIAEDLDAAGNPDGGKNGPVAQVWKKYAASGAMAPLEKQFIKETHYDVAFKKLPKDLQDKISSNKALQQVLWSTAVAHGGAGAAAIFSRNYDPSDTDNTMIRKIYQSRTTGYSKSTPQERAAVMARLAREESLAQDLAQQQAIQVASNTNDASAPKAIPVSAGGGDGGATAPMANIGKNIPSGSGMVARPPVVQAASASSSDSSMPSIQDAAMQTTLPTPVQKALQSQSSDIPSKSAPAAASTSPDMSQLASMLAESNKHLAAINANLAKGSFMEPTNGLLQQHLDKPTPAANNIAVVSGAGGNNNGPTATGGADHTFDVDFSKPAVGN